MWHFIKVTRKTSYESWNNVESVPTFNIITYIYRGVKCDRQILTDVKISLIWKDLIVLAMSRFIIPFDRVWSLVPISRINWLCGALFHFIQVPKRDWHASAISILNFSNMNFKIFFSYAVWPTSKAFAKWNIKLPKAESEWGDQYI